MSTITPAAHRGSIVHSRPLSPVVAPFLQRHLQKVMDHISDNFPMVAVSSDMMKASKFSYGSALVYRPRLLICGDESAGLDHVGLAVLHELEKFPVHSVGLPSLLSDPSAKTPEEALVHIFGEAKRTMPSIIYLPQFQLWWETAHEQLKAVQITLLEELPSNLPILVLGTSSVSISELYEGITSIFKQWNMYEVEKPTKEDRSKFFEKLIEAVFSIPSEETRCKSKEQNSIPELPKAPKANSGPKPSEVKAKAEAEQHALRRLRMCLRDVCNRILYDKRFSAFHYPVSDEDAPNYRSIVQNPMDMATLLQRVDTGQYITCSTFLQDFDLILANAKAYNGDDYTGARIVSRAFELRDAVHGMLSQMDPALVTYCDKIAAEGGPVHFTEVNEDSVLALTPVAHMATVTRASARLRNVQPEVNLSQSYEALKRKKNADTEHSGGNSGPAVEDKSLPEATQREPSQEANGLLREGQPNSPSNDEQLKVPANESMNAVENTHQEDVTMPDRDVSSQVETLKLQLVERTEGYDVPQLERIYTRVVKGVFETKGKNIGGDYATAVLSYLQRFSDGLGTS